MTQIDFSVCRLLTRPLLLIALLAGALAPFNVMFAQDDGDAELEERYDFITFESGPVRPMALSPDGYFLYAVNTPDNHLEVFSVASDGALTHLLSVPVGMEPVAVALHGSDQAWVVNHLSDSVSVVDIRPLYPDDGVSIGMPIVRRTLLVGDEPRDIVFANDRAFITTAHRGQHRTHESIKDVPGAGDPQLHTGGIGRADVWVFDAADLGATVGGTPLKIIELFGDTPRALAASPDGATVYAAVFHSGNQTTVVHEGVMCRGFEDSPAGYRIGTTYDTRAGDEPCFPGQLPPEFIRMSPNGLADGTLPMGRPLPSSGADGEQAPFTAMIVQWDEETEEWHDSRGLNYSNGIRFFLPDKDVFAIDADTLEETAFFPHVGTTLFNMVTNPVNGNIYVSNTNSQNHVRFEGPGIRGGTTVQGNIAQTQITVIDPVTGSVRARPLNRHIDYSILKATTATRDHSLATPLEMQISGDGETLYLAALGSDRIGVIDTADLENDLLWDGDSVEFDPVMESANYVHVAGGPAGLVLNEGVDDGANVLYAFLHLQRGISVVRTDSGEVFQTVHFHNPEPESVTDGRRMLYDANRTSSNGEASCASCHVFGDADQLSWNLGNPDGVTESNPQPFPTFADFWLICHIYGEYDGCETVPYINGNGDPFIFSAMKGPMATQTLRGMLTHGHLHWRGDRANGYFGIDEEQTLDAKFSFKNFIVAVEGLLGRDVALESVDAIEKSDEVLQLEKDMDAFADFILEVQLPPNPIRPLNNELSPAASRGEAFFNGERRADGLSEEFDLDDNENGDEPDGRNCAGCHVLDPTQGFFGTSGDAAHGGEVLILKVPHLRNLYQKVGMFGLPSREGFLPSTTDEHQGDQIRGFGFLHDGATDKLFNFLQGGVFDDGHTTCADLGLEDGDRLFFNVFGCDFNDDMDIGIPDDTTRKDLVEYLMEFDTDLAPIVGQQVTLTADNGEYANPRIDMLIERAGTEFTSFILGGSETVTECELTVKGVIDGWPRGWAMLEDGDFFSDGGETLTDEQLRALAQSQSPLTYTCVPPGSSERMGVDRDRDGVYDALDNCPSVANAGQEDENDDDIGDVCTVVVSDEI